MLHFLCCILPAAVKAEKTISDPFNELMFLKENKDFFCKIYNKELVNLEFHWLDFIKFQHFFPVISRFRGVITTK